MTEKNEPIIGWRVWKIDPTSTHPILISPTKRSGWPVGVHISASDDFTEVCPEDCRMRLIAPKLSAPPETRPHHCLGWGGIHAFSEYTDVMGLRTMYSYTLEGYNNPLVLYVVGKVSLWGKVFRHERGYRAQHAYPSKLYYSMFFSSPEDANAIKLTARRYGVECAPYTKVTTTT